MALNENINSFRFMCIFLKLICIIMKKFIASVLVPLFEILSIFCVSLFFSSKFFLMYILTKSIF